MKQPYTSIILACIVLFSACKAELETTDLAQLSIIPLPLQIEAGEGVYQLKPVNNIYFDKRNTETERVVNYLINRLDSAYVNISLKKNNLTQSSAGIHLLIHEIPDSSLSDEGYLLVINTERIELKANTANGLFYGVQSLLQLMPETAFGNKMIAAEISIPSVSIKDVPRYPYRGMHLDPCRHFISVDFTKKYIDYLAYHKMNVLHWHLTEDQGWRIEIKKYPKLTTIGSKRSETVSGLQYYDESKNSYDGIPHEGFYSQEEIKEIVAYAADRFIQIIPEIEMPGHSRAALASYPNLGCTGGPYEVLTKWGVEDDVFCAGNDETFSFLKDVIDEVIELFPSEYIHIGGDECPKSVWEACDKCQKRIKDESLKDEFELQSYFIHRMEEYINSKGKTIIGWSEIMEGGIAPNAVLESWLGVKGGVEVAKQKHKVIMSPYSHLYLDGINVEPKYKDMEPLGQRYCWTTTEKIYSFEPTPDTIPEMYHPYFIGAEGTMWTEYIATDEHIEYMLLPRLSALSEICWTNNHLKDYVNFKHRLNSQLLRYTAMEANYRIPHPEGLQDAMMVSMGDSIQIINPTNITQIRYTCDGSEPNKDSEIYKTAIAADSSFTLKARCYVNTGRASSTFTATIIPNN